MGADRFGSMQAFVHVVDTGSFSAAARLLCVGQPAISKTIAQLEQRLGVSLLQRSTRGLAPTAAGQQYYARARLALEQADQADAAARGSGAGLSGRLRISSTVTFARLCVIPFLKPLLAQHPQLDLDFVLDDQNIDLMEHGIDVALRLGNQPDSGLIARRIGRARRVVVAAPAYLAEVGEPHRPADLADKDFVIYDTRGGGNHWCFIHADGSEHALTVTGRIRASAAEGIKAGVLAALGFAIVSEWMIRPELDAGLVQQVLPEWQLPALDLWAVFPGGRHVSARAREFVAFLEGQLAQAWPSPSMGPVAD